MIKDNKLLQYQIKQLDQEIVDLQSKIDIMHEEKKKLEEYLEEAKKQL